MAPTWQVVWITGASGGIGRELCSILAKRGSLVAATGRNGAALNALHDFHQNIRAYPGDVTDAEAMAGCAAAIERDLGPIELAIPAAGVYAPFDTARIDLAGFARTSRVNIDGVANTVAAVLPGMLARKRGRILFMGSAFGYCGLPENGSYGASKAFIINFAQSLRLDLASSGVDVTIANPGFVETGLNASYTGKKHYAMQPAKAARRIVEGLDKGSYEIAFPQRVVQFLKTMRCLPPALAERIIRKSLARS